MFDHRYLPRGMVLHESLMWHSPESTLYVLCLSPECRQQLEQLALPHIVPLALEELEAADPALAAAKADGRSLVEYYFTLSPCLPLYLLRTYAIPEILQVDADGAFFADPMVIAPLLQGHSIGITGHRFPQDMLEGERFGKYNVGFQWFSNDAEALRCLEWWRARCLEWCYDRLEADRYADQKYLDCWPALFDAIEIPHKGLNVAPWNFSTFPMECHENTVYIEGDPLCYLHFHGVKHLLGNWWLHGGGMYKKKLPPVLRPLYINYIQQLYTTELYAHNDTGGTLTRLGEHKNFSNFLKCGIDIVTGSAINVLPYSKKI